MRGEVWGGNQAFANAQRGRNDQDCAAISRRIYGCHRLFITYDKRFDGLMRHVAENQRNVFNESLPVKDVYPFLLQDL